MAWISREDQEEQQRKTAQLIEELAETRQKLSVAEDELRFTRAATGVAALVRQTIQDFHDDGNILEIATEMARERVEQDERERFTAELADRIEDETAEGYRALFRKEEEPALREKIKAENAQNGTDELIRLRIRAEEAQRVGQEVELETEEKERAAIDTPEERDRIYREEVEKARSSDKMEQYRRGLRTRLRQDARATAHVDVRAEIDQEEAADAIVYGAEYRAEYAKSPEAQQYRLESRERLQRKEQKEGTKSVLGTIDTEEIRSLRERRAEQDRARLEREVRATEVLEGFTHGIKLNTLEPDLTLVIQLGVSRPYTWQEKERDRYGDMRSVEKIGTELVVARELTLTTLGNGQFILDRDSLGDIAPDDPMYPYLHNDAIPHGAVITIGRVRTENGQERLDPTLKAGVVLYYDDTPDTPEVIKSTERRVANIIIGGQSAKTFSRVVSPVTLSA